MKKLLMGMVVAVILAALILTGINLYHSPERIVERSLHGYTSGEGGTSLTLKKPLIFFITVKRTDCRLRQSAIG